MDGASAQPGRNQGTLTMRHFEVWIIGSKGHTIETVPAQDSAAAIWAYARKHNRKTIDCASRVAKPQPAPAPAPINAERAALISQFAARIQLLQDDTSCDVVLTWPNGLCVGIDGEGQPFVTNALHAKGWPQRRAAAAYVFRNGAGERARPADRQFAIHREITELRRAIELLQGIKG